MGSSGRDGRSLRVLAVEPYYGGSHRAFLDGLAGASGHEFRLLTMPARKWKWRMRGSAMWCVQELAEKGIEEVVIGYRSPWQSPYVERLISSIRG